MGGTIYAASRPFPHFNDRYSHTCLSRPGIDYHRQLAFPSGAPQGRALRPTRSAACGGLALAGQGPSPAAGAS
jgi:hypothetical protein